MTDGPNVSRTGWRATSTPFHGLAIVCTSFRLYHRHHKRRMWWDDYWAFASLLCDIVYSLTPWLRTDGLIRSPTRKDITVFWLTAVLFPFVVWTARISIGLSIARLVPPETRKRKLLYTLTVGFGLMLVALMVQKLWVCCRDTSWYHNGAVQCYLGNTVGILSLCMDVIADTCLVVIPVHMLWRVKLPRTQRRLILSIFASSIVSSLAGIVYAVFVFGAQISHSRNWGRAVGLAANIKAAVTLLVCNMLVIATYMYCLFWKDDDDDVSEPSETRSKTSRPPEPTTVITLTEISDRFPLDSQPYHGGYFDRSQYTGPPVSTSQSTFAPVKPPTSS